MKLIRISEAKPIEGHCLQLKLTDGSIIERDLGPMLAGPGFSDVRSSQVLFREVRVEAGSLVWPNGADICPDVVIWGGLPPADADSTGRAG